MNEIVRQIDSSDMPGISNDVVGFVEAVDVYRGPADAPWTEHRYFAAVYRRPVSPYTSTALATCGHEHHEIHTAARCVRRLLRAASRVAALVGVVP